MVDLIVHIGYPKTATTSLQEHFFLKLHKEGKVNFLGKSDHFEGFKNYSSILKNTTVKNEKKFSLDVFFSQLLPDKLNIVSDEDFTLSFIGIKNQSRLFSCHPLETVENLVKVFKVKNINLKFIATVRRQDSLVYSTYVQGYKAYFSKEADISPFDCYLIKGFNRGEQGHFLMFYFNKILSAYGRAFGSENVAVALFEDLINDQEKFASDFCKFFPVHKNDLMNACSFKENEKKKSAEGYKVHDTLMSDKVVYLVKLVVPNDLVAALKKFKSIRYIYDKLIHKASAVSVAEGFTVPYLTTAQKVQFQDFFYSENLALCENFNLDENKMKKYGYLK